MQEEILEKNYLTADDLMVLIPGLTYARALQYIKDAQREMREKNFYVPVTQKKVALTKLIRKRFGF